MKLIRTDPSNKDFRFLVSKLDALLTVLDGKDFPFYTQFNQLDSITEAVVVYLDDVAAGCGALKPFGNGLAEVKRMFVDPVYRNRGIASRILSELETIAKDSGYEGCVLETGQKQVEAIGLYKKSNYRLIPNYGQYIGVDNSVCMEKRWK